MCSTEIRALDLPATRAAKSAVARPDKLPRAKLPPPPADLAAGLDGAPQPLVSIVMPVYNRAVLLPMPVQSVLDQTWSNRELLAVDDGSDDDSMERLMALAGQDPRLRLLRPGRCGLVPALTLGLAEAAAP